LTLISEPLGYRHGREEPAPNACGTHMEKPAILIAEEDSGLRQRLRGLLLRRGFEVVAAADRTTALRSLQQERPCLVIAGSGREAWDGLELAQEIRRRESRIPIILVTTDSSEDRAVAALRAGVNDYFKQPVSLDAIGAAVGRCLGDALPGQGSSPSPSSPAGFERMIGKSPVMRDLRAQIMKVAPTDSTVLITGETGAGKELAAELIHRKSPRRHEPFVRIDCAAIPESLVESELFGYERGAFTGADCLKEGLLKLAGGGTVFFDEVGDMSLAAQAKILRAVETKEIRRLGARGSIPLRVRVIAATHRDLEAWASEGKFRQDLYFRLNVARVHIPPLRDRKEDIPLLSAHYIAESNGHRGERIEGFTDEVQQRLLRYQWPGNVRELKNLIEASFVDPPSGRVRFVDLPDHFRRRLQDADMLPRDERDRVLFALLSTKGNKSEAALKLNWSRMTLYRKLAKYRIEDVKSG